MRLFLYESISDFESHDNNCQCMLDIRSDRVEAHNNLLQHFTMNSIYIPFPIRLCFVLLASSLPIFCSSSHSVSLLFENDADWEVAPEDCFPFHVLIDMTGWIELWQSI